MVERPNTIWRDFATAGVPSSGAHKPRKAEIRAWGEYIQAFLNAGNFLGYTTKSALDADLDHAAGSVAIVYSESAANDGLYVKSGASGAGSWARIGGVPGFSFETAVDDGGTANAILATTTGDVNSARLIALPIEITNTATPVTVSFNSATALTIKTAAGNNPAIGGLVAGTILLGYGDGTNFRLLSDQASTAIQAAAEAAQAAAEAAQALAESARDDAQDARDDSVAAKEASITASEASGDTKFADTYSDASALLPLADGTAVLVFADENKSGMRTRYVVESSALVFKMYEREGVLYAASATVAAGLGLSIGDYVDIGKRRYKLTSGDFSTEVAADTLEAMYFADGAIADTTAAWVLQHDGIVSLEVFGLSTSNSAAANTSALAVANAVLASFTGTVTCAPGTYLTNGPFKIPRHASFASWGLVVFDATGSTGTFADGAVVTKIGATPTSLPALASDVAENATTISYASAHGLSVGDIVVFLDDNDYSFSLWRTYYKKGGIHKVLSVGSTTQVTLDRPIHYAMTSADVDCYLAADLATGDIQRIKGIGPGNVGSNLNIEGVRFEWVYNATFRNVESYTTGNVAADYIHCFRCKSIEDKHIKIGTDGSERYGLVSSNNVECRWSGEYEGDRHGMAQGGGADFAFHNFDVIGSGIFRSHTAGLAAADLHGNILDCGYEDFVCYGGGCNVAGDRSIHRNGRIYSSTIPFNGRELVSTEHFIYDVWAHNASNDTTRGGAINIGGNEDAITANTTKGGTIVVRNLRGRLDTQQRSIITVRNRGYVRVNDGNWDASAGTFPSGASDGDVYKVSVAGTVGGVAFTTNHYLKAITASPSTTVYSGNWRRETSDYGIDADGVEFTMPGGLNVAALVYVSRVSGDGIGRAKAHKVSAHESKQTYSLYLNTSQDQDAVTSQDGCSGEISVTTGTGVSVVDTTVTFPKPFTKAPKVDVQLVGSPTTSSDRIAATAFSVSSTTVVIRVYRTDATSNFSAAVTRTVQWKATLEEGGTPL